MTFLEAAGWTVLMGGATSIFLTIARQLTTLRRGKEIYREEMRLLGERLSAVRASRRKAEVSTAPWNGTRKFRVAKKTVEKGDICSFYLSPHDGKLPLPHFMPGQFLTFQLTIDGRSETRCYSLSDSPDPNYYRVSIKRCAPPRDEPDAPPGLVSSYFHDTLDEGDLLDVLAPRGAFTIDPAEGTPLVLSGAGIGVTPVFSMMKSLIDVKSRREIYFFYGVRNGGENMIAEDIREWRALDLPNVHVHVCFSNPAPEDIKGEDYDHKSRVSVELFKELLQSNNFEYYTCGPGRMMDSIRDGLAEWGVPSERVHDEAFIAVKKAVEVKAATVSFRKSGKSLQVSGAATSLLDLATTEGITIPFGCCTGGCGTCKTAIISGKVEYECTPKIHVESGSCLPCVCLPNGDLVLDA
ncbi:MAG: 2Fe-2S iron-sulfur cluster-binding protein [Roseibacillus sp.]